MTRSRLSLRAEELLSYFTGLAPVGSTIEKKKRPDHEIEAQRLHLAVLRQAADEYRNAAARAA